MAHDKAQSSDAEEGSGLSEPTEHSKSPASDAAPANPLIGDGSLELKAVPPVSAQEVTNDLGASVNDLEASKEQVIEQQETSQSRTEAQKAIKSLFERLGIGRVICVDDVYATSLDQAIELATVVAVTGGGSDIEELDDLNWDESDIRREQLRRHWDNWDHSTKTHVVEALRKQASAESKAVRAASLLSEIIVQPPLTELSFEQWKADREVLLQEAQDAKTLFLFDQNLSDEGGTEEEGYRLVADVLAHNNSENVICGVLSSMFVPEDEHPRWKDLPLKRKIDRNRCVLISKQRLSNDPLGFARMVKLALLNKQCEVLKQEAASVICDAQQEAQTRVDELDIYDFEHIVFHSSRREGVWEPDTLFRLHGLFQRQVARRLARSNEPLRSLASRIRRVTDVPLASDGPPVLSTWKVQRAELYEDGSYLNEHYMPIEIGDIFAKTSSTPRKKFVLIAQPCDLMVRSNGERNRAVVEAVLAEVVQEMPTNSEGHPTGHEMHFPMPYFTDDSPSTWYVNLRRVTTVKLSMLDLCVYSCDGMASYQIGDACPVGVTPSWEERFVYVSDEWTSAIKRYEKFSALTFEAAIKKEVLAAVLPTCSNNNLFKPVIKIQEHRIEFPCQRVGRLANSRAIALLAQYSGFLSRAAFEHDLGGT